MTDRADHPVMERSSVVEQLAYIQCVGGPIPPVPIRCTPHLHDKTPITSQEGIWQQPGVFLHAIYTYTEGSDFTGGRGGGSGMSNEKPVSERVAKWYYNAAKKSDALRSSGTVKRDSKLEKIIKSENTDYFKSIKTEKEARRVSEYLTDRMGENERKLAKLGSPEAVFKNQRVAIEHRKLTSASVAMSDQMHKFSKRPEKGDPTLMHDLSHVTTTYERARKRRMKNFDAWFFGSGKK